MDNSFENDADRYFSEVLLKNIKQQNNYGVLSIFGNKNPSQLTNSFGSTLLHYAAKYGNNWLVRYLIGLGAKVNSQNHAKQTPLMLAVENHQVGACKILINANADMYLPDESGQCALGKAFISDRKEDFLTIMKYRLTSKSLTKSAHAKTTIFHRYCPLYFFMQFRNAELTKTLINNGSPVNARKPITGETSLHLAITNLDSENVKVLLESGADLNIKRYDTGEIPLKSLLNIENEDRALDILSTVLEVAAALFDRHKWYLIVGALLMHGTEKIVRRVLENLTSLYIQDNNGCTPLHYLAKNKNPDILAVLRNYNFHKDIRTESKKWTMLHCAAISGNPSSVKFLLDYGLAVSDRSSLECTALDYIIFKINDHDSHRLDDYVKCVEILLIYGADFRILSRNNQRNQGSEIYTEAISMVLMLHVQSIIVGLTVDNEISKFLIELMKPIVAHESLIKVIGQEVGRNMETDILTIPEFKCFSVMKIAELEKMKEVQLSQSVTLFEFLIADKGQVSRYARYRKLVEYSFKTVEQYYLDSYYQLRLYYNYLEFKKLKKSREIVADDIQKFIAVSFDNAVRLVAEKIVELLDDCWVEHFRNSVN